MTRSTAAAIGSDRDILKLFMEKMRRRLGDDLVQLVLFGSRARGDNSADSDFDCLAVFKKISPRVKDRIDEIAGEMLFERNAVFFIMPMLEKRKRRRRFDPLLSNIEREGIVL